MKAEARDSDNLTWRGEVARKSIHVFVVVLPILLLSAQRGAATTGLVVLAAMAVAADVLRAYWDPFGRLIERIFGRLMRSSELEVGHGRVRINSATFLLVGSLCSLVLFGPTIAALGLLLFLPADAAAGLVGRHLGRRRWAFGRATIMGTGAFILVGLVVCGLVPALGMTRGAIAVLVSAAVEAVTPIDDNLVVPVVAATVIFLIS